MRKVTRQLLVIILVASFMYSPATAFAISPYGRQVAEDFLMQLPMMFGDYFNGWYPDGLLTYTGQQMFLAIPRQLGTELTDGQIEIGWDWDTRESIIADERQFLIGYEGGEMFESHAGYLAMPIPILTTEVPDIFFREFRDWTRHGFYDSNFNRIEDAPWMSYETYASSFSLWDFDNSGIPDIIVNHWGNYRGSGDGGGVASLFRYVNGEFVRVSYSPQQLWEEFGFGREHSYSWFPWVYYHDNLGNLVGYFYGIVEPIPTYARITFNNNAADKFVLARASNAYWTNYLTGERDFLAPIYETWGDNRPAQRVLPGTDITLTRVNPLTDLHLEISASVRERLDAYQAESAINETDEISEEMEEYLPEQEIAESNETLEEAEETEKIEETFPESEYIESAEYIPCPKRFIFKFIELQQKSQKPHKLPAELWKLA